MNKLSSHLQKLEKVDKNKPKTGRKKEYSRTKTNEIENRMTIEKNQ